MTAEAAPLPPPPAPTFTTGLFCSTCKHQFTDLVKLRLVVALWAKYAPAEETNLERLAVSGEYTAALGDAGGHAEAARLKRPGRPGRPHSDASWGPIAAPR